MIGDNRWQPMANSASDRPLSAGSVRDACTHRTADDSERTLRYIWIPIIVRRLCIRVYYWD